MSISTITPNDFVFATIQTKLLYSKNAVTHILHVNSEAAKMIHDDFANTEFQVMVKDGEEEIPVTIKCSVFYGKFTCFSELVIHEATTRVVGNLSQQWTSSKGGICSDDSSPVCSQILKIIKIL